MIQRFLRNLVIVCFVFLLPLSAFPYDQNTVHKKINEAATRRSTNLVAVLQTLGFDQGMDSLVNGKAIYKWFQDGGKLEDETDCRSKFHFHDPTKSFDQAGLSNIAIDTWCGNYNHRSSLVWAQDTADNLWSWQQARLYYLGALAGANKDLREEQFASTFRALGQVMHLVSDASVPAHVRNDIHIFPREIPGLNIQIGRPTYESWAKANPNKLSYGGVQIGESIFKEAVNNNIAPVPISALWDQNKYTGYNPADAVGTNIGIAEYTNANFFSEDTIFKNFTYPSRDSVTQVSYEIDDPRNPSGKVLREYYQKIAHGDTGYRLATVGFLKDYLFTFLPDQVINLRPFEKPALDGEVYGDYAARLVPRAVGYSAGLLDYFFRGKLEMAPAEDGEGYVIENKTEEDMDGAFELYYDATDNQRKQCWSGSFALGALSSGNNKRDTITFTPPTDAKEPGKYILVFQGRLGNEDNAVVGKYCNLQNVFIFPKITKISAIDNHYEHVTAQFAEGTFVGLIPGGGQGSTVGGRKRITFHTSSIADYFTLYINNIQMPGYYWDSQEHLSQTGSPLTWRLEGHQWRLVYIEIAQQGYDTYWIEYPTVEFGYVLTDDCNLGCYGACADGEGGQINGNAKVTTFSGSLRLPLRGTSIPYYTTIKSNLYPLFETYPYGAQQVIAKYDYKHHGYIKDGFCRAQSWWDCSPFPPSCTSYWYLFDLPLRQGEFWWGPGKIGSARAQSTSLSSSSAFRPGGYKSFNFGSGRRSVLTSDLLECWDCSQDVNTSHYYRGNIEVGQGGLLWPQPYRPADWGLSWQIKDSYLEELFQKYHLDLLDGKIAVEMDLPQELFGE